LDLDGGGGGWIGLVSECHCHSPDVFRRLRGVDGEVETAETGGGGGGDDDGDGAVVMEHNQGNAAASWKWSIIREMEHNQGNGPESCK